MRRLLLLLGILWLTPGAADAQDAFPGRFRWPDREGTAFVGLYSNDHPSEIPANALQAAHNATFGTRGRIAKRDGSTVVATAAEIGEIIEDGIQYTNTDLVSKLVLFTASSIYELSEASATYTWSATDGYPVATEFDGMLLAVNGRNDPIWSHDGTSWETLGLSAWSTLSAVIDASATATMWPGTYKYLITRGNQWGHESGPYPGVNSPVIVDVTGAEQVVLSLPDAGGVSTTNTVRIYRTEPDGARFFLLIELDAAADYSSGNDWYDDGTTALGSKELDDIDPNTPPAGASCIAAYRERVFAATGSTLYYSGVLNPQNWSPWARFSPVGARSAITHLCELQGALIVFTGDAVYSLTGSDPADFEMVRISPLRGTLSPRSVKQVGNMLFYLSQDREVHYLERTGAYTFSGGAIGQEPLSWQVSDKLASIPAAKLDDVAGGVLEDRYHLAYAPTASATANSGWLVAFPGRPYQGEGRLRIPWTEYQDPTGSVPPVRCFIPYTTTTTGNVLYAGLDELYDATTTVTTLVRVEDPAASTDARDGESGAQGIIFDVRSKRFDFGSIGTTKTFRRVYWRIATRSAGTLQFIFPDTQQTVSIPLSSNVDPRYIWGLNTWDTLYWGRNDADLTVGGKSLPMTATGRTLEVRLYDQGANSRMELVDLEVDYNELPRREP